MALVSFLPKHLTWVSGAWLVTFPSELTENYYPETIIIKNNELISLKLQRCEKTITLKMADQRWSDIYVVFTKILCGHNFCVW